MYFLSECVINKARSFTNNVAWHNFPCCCSLSLTRSLFFSNRSEGNIETKKPSRSFVVLLLLFGGGGEKRRHKEEADSVRRSPPPPSNSSLHSFPFSPKRCASAAASVSSSSPTLTRYSFLSSSLSQSESRRPREERRRPTTELYRSIESRPTIASKVARGTGTR